MAITIVAAEDDEGFMSTEMVMTMMPTMIKTMSKMVILIVIIVILVKGQCSLSVAALTAAFAVFQKTRPGSHGDRDDGHDIDADENEHLAKVGGGKM